MMLAERKVNGLHNNIYNMCVIATPPSHEQNPKTVLQLIIFSGWGLNAVDVLYITYESI